MTAHNCKEHNPLCFRCDLNTDEFDVDLRDELAREIAKHFPINDRFTSKSLMIKCMCGELAPTWHGHLADVLVDYFYVGAPDVDE